jgi:hypothetical protein
MPGLNHRLAWGHLRQPLFGGLPFPRKSCAGGLGVKKRECLLDAGLP